MVPSFSWNINGNPLALARGGCQLPLRDLTNASRTAGGRLWPAAWPFLAYEKIYNDCLRYPDFEDEIDVMNKDFFPQRAHWDNNYFTRARKYQQRGNPELVPVAGMTLSHSPLFHTFVGSGDSFSVIRLHGVDTIYPVGTGQRAGHITYTASDIQGHNIHGSTALEDHDLSGLSFNLNDLAIHMAVQRYNVNNARMQPMYRDYMRARYGVNIDDGRLQLPEYLGSYTFTVNHDVVTATSAYEQQHQGHMTGQSWASNQNSLSTIEFDVKEHGIIMSILTVRPVAVYEGGMPRELMYTNRLDFPTPELANLLDVAIRKSEVNWLTPTAENLAYDESADSTFGYTDIYSECRTQMNHVSGMLRPSIADNLGSYTMDMFFRDDEKINLNKEFLQCNCDDLAASVFQYTDLPHFLFYLAVDYKCALPLPVRSEPFEQGL